MKTIGEVTFKDTSVRSNWNVILKGIEEAIHDAINPIRKEDGFLDLEKTKRLYHKILGKKELLHNMDESCHLAYTDIVYGIHSSMREATSKLQNDVWAEFEKLDKVIATLEGTLDEAHRISELMKG